MVWSQIVLTNFCISVYKYHIKGYTISIRHLAVFCIVTCIARMENARIVEVSRCTSITGTIESVGIK